MEQEVRYFFSKQQLEDVKKMLSRYRFLYITDELTIMYDNSNQQYSFYDKSVDGRLRLRTCRSIASSKFGKAIHKYPSSCLLSWKKRLPQHADSSIRKEEEIECNIAWEEAMNMQYILTDVLKCPRVSSYERIRNNFDSKAVKITCDQFPYGLMLEFELKEGFNAKCLLQEVGRCNLLINEASKLSCDDMYVTLCKRDLIEPKNDILFNDKNMPQI